MKGARDYQIVEKTYASGRIEYEVQARAWDSSAAGFQWVFIAAFDTERDARQSISEEKSKQDDSKVVSIVIIDAEAP